MIDGFGLTDLVWPFGVAALLMVLGVVTTWRGLIGGTNDRRGLLRRPSGTVQLMEGWQLTIVGLTLIGFGIGWVWEIRWLFFLSLGIGFVEVQEAGRILDALRWNGGGRESEVRSQESGIRSPM